MSPNIGNEHSRLKDPLFISREQLAARWGCSISTLKRREKDGLKSIRFGARTIRYALAEIEEIERTR